MTGYITRMLHDKGYGFLRGEDGVSRFFHASACKTSKEFDLLRERQPVVFEPTVVKQRPRALNVRKMHES